MAYDCDLFLKEECDGCGQCTEEPQRIEDNPFWIEEDDEDR